MKLNIFDLHCDTALRLYTEKMPLAENTFHIDLKKAEKYPDYTQIMAIWCDEKLDDEKSYSQFLSAVGNFKNEVSANADKAAICLNYGDAEKARAEKKRAFFLGVEDARLLAGDLSRLDVLYGEGVRFLTMTWKNESCVGGAFNTSSPLTDFGKKVVSRCFDLGIIPDISHASEYTADDVMNEAKKRNLPFAATHSNAYSVFGHPRNLRDRHIDAIKELGGIIGISLCRIHLTENGESCCKISDIIPHIEYYMSRGGEKFLALGCDLDGTDLPDGINDISDLYKIADELGRLNYSDTLINKIFYENADNFIKKNLK